MDSLDDLLVELLRCDERAKDSPNPAEIKKQIAWSLQFGAMLEANRSGVFSIDNLAGLPAHLHDWPTTLNYIEQATGIDARKSTAELIAALRELHARGDIRARQSAGTVERAPHKVGRLDKVTSEAKRMELLAFCSAHPTLMNDFPALAQSVGVSESTARRWLKIFNDKHTLKKQ